MTATTFMDETEPLEDVVTVPDTVPELSGVDNPCKTCGNQIDVPYGGRGRRPTQCNNCKGNRKSASVKSKNLGNNAVLAAQATEAVMAIDGALALGARLVGLFETADAIQADEDVFRLRLNAALQSSPKMARRLLTVGEKTGESAFWVAIGLHVMAFAPVAKNEIAVKRAEKAAQQAEELE